ncbi:MAG: HPr family phosphocarrier protein [Candidatus Omnitrophica bacterium]|nr:HPr family phosphocarrier protein [Candidatus Omnitrophota bacterium]
MVIKKEVTIKNKSGLHARPAALFVQAANKFTSGILIIKDDQQVNGKSIMGILMLAAEKGSKITIVAEGDDALRAAEELSAILAGDIDTLGMTAKTV